MPLPADPTADRSSPGTATAHHAPALERRIAKGALVALGLAATLLVVLGVLLAGVDWNRAKPWINEKVSEATGRHFAIEGNLSAAWRWPQPLEGVSSFSVQ